MSFIFEGCRDPFIDTFSRLKREVKLDSNTTTKVLFFACYYFCRHIHIRRRDFNNNNKRDDRITSMCIFIHIKVLDYESFAFFLIEIELKS